eukprot:7264640-Prymnesium_polylepis.2
MERHAGAARRRDASCRQRPPAPAADTAPRRGMLLCACGGSAHMVYCDCRGARDAVVRGLATFTWTCL